MDRITKVLIAIIVVIILLNLYFSATLLEGTWQSTDEFTDSSGTQMYLNLEGKIKKTARIILIKDGETIIKDGHFYFINYNPGTLFLTKTCGYVKCTGFEDVMPATVKFEFSPLYGTLRLYDKIEYGSFVKFY